MYHQFKALTLEVKNKDREDTSYMIESFKVQKVRGRDFLIKVEFSDPIQISSDSTSPDFLFISLNFRFLFVTQKG